MNDTLIQAQLDTLEQGNQVEFVNQPKDVDSKKPSKEKREEAMAKAFYISVAYDYNRMHFADWEGDEKWSENYGNQDGMYYAVGFRSPNALKFFGHPFIEGYYRQYANMVHYKSIFADMPYDAEQRSKVKQWGAKIGSWNKISDKSEIYGYLDIGRRIWNRGEDTDLGLADYHEKFSWYYTGLGAGINHRFFPRFSTGLEAEAMFGWGARDHRNDLDITYRLGSVFGAEFKLPLKYYLLESLSFDFTPYFTFWNVDSSNIVEDNYKRDSYTHLEGLLVGLTYSF